MKRLIMILTISLICSLLINYCQAQMFKHAPEQTQPSHVFMVPENFPTIQKAIDRATDGCEILVTPGTYTENIDLLGKAITLRSDADGNWKTYDIDAEQTVIDGGNPIDPNFASVAMICNNEGNDTVLEGFTLMNGSGLFEPGYNVSHGGGVYCSGASPTIKNNIFTANAAIYGNGGGIHVESGAPVIENNRFLSTGAANGGGIYLSNLTEPLTLIGNEFVECIAYENGGAIYCANSELTLGDGHTMATCQSGFGSGGGMYCFNTTCDIQPGNTFAANSTGFNGGGVCFDSCPFVTVEGTLFAGNKGGNGGNIACDNSFVVLEDNDIHTGGWPTMLIHHWGGGIWCKDSQMEILNNKICNNESPYGGALYAENTIAMMDNNIVQHNVSADDGTGKGGALHLVSSDFTLTNNLIADNSALFSGGGIYCIDNTILTLINNTFAGNMVGSYGISICAFNYCTIDCMNNIFYHDSIKSEISVWDSTVSVAYCLIRDGQDGLFADPDSTVNWNGGLIDADPLFATGPQGDYYLSQFMAGQPQTSVCVDSGEPGSDLIDGTTRTDELPDDYYVDMGFHYSVTE